jgi:hypothetical protein
MKPLTVSNEGNDLSLKIIELFSHFRNRFQYTAKKLAGLFLFGVGQIIQGDLVQ